ncbi:MAG: PDZ domain-containing protein [Verrucomicrobiales bacterium]|nr:PDZ domain-containing protein [Verrucomicrobiales bacterium]
MRTSSLTFLAVGSSILLTIAPAPGEEKVTPVEGPRPENRDTSDVAKKEQPPRPGQPDSVEKRIWVGVATAPIDSVLRDHLEIAEGFGIQVIEVMPDSPASAAGLRNNDIITLFEDQHLISPEHLSLLVRTKKGGDKVAFAIIRKGKEEIVELTLGETDAERFPSPPGFGPGHPFPEHRENLRRQQDYWQDWMNKNHPEWRGNSSRREDRPDHEEPTQDARDSNLPRESRPPAISVSPGFPLRVFGSEGVLKIDNEQGELTLTRKDKDHTLELKDDAGKVIYKGTFDPEAGVEALPREAREHLEKMKLGNFEVRLPAAPMKGPEKTAAPPVEEPAAAPEGEIL